MLAACGTAGNRDLEPHIDALVSCIANPGEVPAVIGKLSATTFVQVRVGCALCPAAPCRALLCLEAAPAAPAGAGQPLVGGARRAHPSSTGHGWRSWLAACALTHCTPPCTPAGLCSALQAMEDGTLAVMVPLMIRALRERSTVVNRRASVIIENMSKLVR